MGGELVLVTGALRRAALLFLCTARRAALLFARPALRPTVFDAGASGFIANHCVKTLAQEGYKVRGTVRSNKDEKQVLLCCGPFRRLHPQHCSFSVINL